MTKLLLALITTAAFFYALYLLAHKRPLKIVSRRENESGFIARARYLFLLATAVFLSACTTERPEAPTTMCYDIAEPIPQSARPANASATVNALRTAWRTLVIIPNGKNRLGRTWFRYEEGERGANEAAAALKATLDHAVADRLLSAAAANEIQVIHAALSYHFWRSNCGATCYMPRIQIVGKTGTVDDLQKQLDLLRQARNQGALSPDVVQKAESAILQKVEILSQLDAIAKNDNRDYEEAKKQETALADAIKANTLAISPTTIEATALILQLEDAPFADPATSPAGAVVPASPSVPRPGTPAPDASPAPAPLPGAPKGQ